MWLPRVISSLTSLSQPLLPPDAVEDILFEPSELPVQRLQDRESGSGNNGFEFVLRAMADCRDGIRLLRLFPRASRAFVRHF